MIRAERVMQATVNSSGINKVGKCHLVDPPEALVVWVRNNFQYKGVIDSDETIYRIVNDFPVSIRHYCKCSDVRIYGGGISMNGK